VSKADHYQKLAAECLLLAKTANIQTNKITLLQMAGTWLKLAERELTAHVLQRCRQARPTNSASLAIFAAIRRIWKATWRLIVALAHSNNRRRQAAVR
jgi:DNA-binding transcriptional regulator PaaX